MTPKLAWTACSRRALALHPNELGKGHRLTHTHKRRTRGEKGEEKKNTLKCFNKCMHTQSSIHKERARLCVPHMRVGTRREPRYQANTGLIRIKLFIGQFFNRFSSTDL